MICNVFPHTLSRLLLALCPNVTSSNFPSIQFPVISIFILAFTPFIWFCYRYALCADCKLYSYFVLLPLSHPGGIQFAAAQLPHLRLFDCGMTICDPSVENPSVVENGLPADNSSQEPKYQQKVSNTKLYPMYQKLIIKHGRLKKLSLWGCSGLDVRLRKRKTCFALGCKLEFF